jgi:GcrA cell cycle regulator
MPAMMDDEEAAEARLVPLLELTDKDCKWPIGEPGKPGFGFCAQPRWKPSPYCVGHTRIAFGRAPETKMRRSR